MAYSLLSGQVANGQYLEKPYQQQQPIVLQPSLRCDCPTFGVIDGFAHLTNLILLLLSFFFQYRLMKQNQENGNNIRQNPAQIPNGLYRQEIPALMAHHANPFLT